MPLTQFDLNAIILCHLTRFFAAARSAIERINESDDAIAASAATLLGNMIWASSSFDAQSKEQERAMAYSGAIVGSLGDRVVTSGSDSLRQQALGGLAAIERQLLDNTDALIELVYERLRRRRLLHASPGLINDAVWRMLFPRCPYGDHAAVSESLARLLS